MREIDKKKLGKVLLLILKVVLAIPLTVVFIELLFSTFMILFHFLLGCVILNNNSTILLICVIIQ